MIGCMQGRGKKDAKQVAAAAVLEMLLANVPEQDFLQPGKGKFLRLKVCTPSFIILSFHLTSLFP